ncbi:MAG: hypothetical protein K2I91_03755, partial [Muribaculaceae bacterium]|nr:hypothetical protein [Muribaculaceae bacterium]
DASSTRSTTLKSPYINGSITSEIMPTHIVSASVDMLRNVAPALLGNTLTGKSLKIESPYSGKLNFAFTIDKNINRQQLFSMPVQLLYPVTIGGDIDYSAGTAAIKADAPYLQQGKDKLIRETSLGINIADSQARVDFHSIIPTKKGILNLYTDILAANDAADINLHFNPDSGSAFTGDLAMRAEYHPDLNPSGRKATLRFIPSTLYLNGAEWHVGRSYAEYYDKQLEIRDFNIAHENQHIAINGIASPSTDDMMVVDLSDINLDYIFDTLNINYVSFGGTATGQAIAAGAFSPTPDAHTRNLTVRDLSYNHCVLGNAKLLGDFDIKNMRIGIKADIEEEERPVASVDGGIWLGGRDSLSFGIDADRVRVDFLQTFMQAFARDVSGRASGRGLLYGT